MTGTERAVILSTLEAVAWVVEGPRGAAVRLGLHPATLLYRMRRLGIERPRASARVDQHAPATALTAELAMLRRFAAALRSNYPPTPGRAAMLHRNEVAQRAVLAQLRGSLGDRPVFGGVRAPAAPGALRPAWLARW